MKQLVINGKKSYDDFGVCIATRKISQPKKKSIKGSVPFSNVTYDFSKIDGEIYWEERTLTYTFDIAEFTTEEMEDVKEKLLDWLLNVHDADIYDPYIDGYHFHGSFDSDSWDEDFGAGTLGISFTVYPYKIANEDAKVVEEIGVEGNGAKRDVFGFKITGRSIQNEIPTPEAPVNIKSVEVGEIYSCGKNLLKLNSSKEMHGVIVTVNDNGTITFNGTATATCDIWLANGTSSNYINIPVKKGTAITQSVNENGVGSYVGEVELRTITKDGNKTYWGNLSNDSTFVTSEDSSILATELLIQANTSFDNWTIFPQVELGNVATTPQKYNGAKIVLENPIILYSLPNGVHDVLENGVVTRNVGKFVVDGNQPIESIEVNETTGNTTFIFSNSMISDEKKGEYSLPFCDQLTGTQSRLYRNFENQVIQWGDTSASFCVGMSTDCVGTTVDSITAWFKKNPMTILYELSAPKNEVIDIPEMQRYEPLTVVGTDSLLQTTFEVYYNETKKVSVYNDSSHRISPTIIADGSFTVTMNNTSYAISSGTYEATEFYLEGGLNEVSISGYGTITFSYKGEKF